MMAHLPELPTEQAKDEAAEVAESPSISAAELTPSARIGGVLFRNRGWLPILFLGVPLIAQNPALKF